MATSSITRRIVIKDDKAADTLKTVLAGESPCKDIKPVTDAELKKGEDYAKKWLSQSR